jgi:hypothetical protein
MIHTLRRLAILGVALATTSAHAAQVTIGSVRDTTIYRSQVNNGNSLGVGMFVGQDPGGASTSKRALIGFDIAGNIPAGSTITSVQLGLTFGQAAGSGGTLGNGDQTPRQIDLFRMTADWAEGTSGTGNTTIGGSGQGFAASAGEPTWPNRVHPSTPWSTVGGGGDFSATVSASTVVGNPTTNLVYTWGTTAAMIADVQLWLDDASQNFGWILKANNETATQSFRAFYTRNATNAAFRPYLIVDYVPEPATVVSLGMGALGFAFVALRSRARRRTRREALA